MGAKGLKSAVNEILRKRKMIRRVDQPILFTRMGYSLKKSLNKEKNYLSLARRVFGLNGPLAVPL